MTLSWKGVVLIVVVVVCLTQLEQVGDRLVQIGDISCMTGQSTSSGSLARTSNVFDTAASWAAAFLPDNNYERYIPAPVEDYVVSHVKELGYDVESRDVSGCNIWTDPQATPHYNELQQFRQEMLNYTALLKAFPPMKEDLRVLLKRNPEQRDQICASLNVAPGGVRELFPSLQLSYTRAGYVEPLLPPMRHWQLCYSAVPHASLRLKQRQPVQMRMDYMVHDFEAMCRALKPDSRMILIDMGAALDFHSHVMSPAIYATKLYHQFGFKFDHIYAFEIQPKVPKQVYNKVPEELMASYHWINIGVSADPKSQFNPLTSILKNIDKDDFVVVKLDIDTGSIEVPLAHQILNDSVLAEKIDQFYFEHHVTFHELAPSWGDSMNGTIEDTLRLFQGLRQKGVAAHFWP